MKKILFLAALVLTAMQASAGPVTVSQAQARALHFMQNNASNRLGDRPIGELKLLHAETVATSHLSQSAYYIFNASDAFVIVAGDDRAREILAYGEGTLDMNAMPENMKFWLSYYKRQMEYLYQNPDLKVSVPVMRGGVNVEPMIEATWDQGSPYYNMCPKDGDVNSMTGCATTSLAQVFYHWKFPDVPTQVIPGYTTRNGKFTLSALPSVTFDWEHMLPRYWFGQYESVNATAVAQLMRYIGQAEQMNYARDGSDAWEDDVVRACHLLGYEDAVAVYKGTMNFETGEETTYIDDDEWCTLMQEELQAGRPMVFCAFDYNSGHNSYSGHAFNVDGYRATDGMFHINWGWSGTGNGYFAMNAFSNQGANYHLGQRIVKNIYPSIAEEPTIKVYQDQLNMHARLGEPSTATFTVWGKLLTGDITLTLNDANGVYALDATTVTLDESQDVKLITVTYNPDAAGEHPATVTLSSPGAQDKVVTLNGKADITVFDPVMLPADESAVNLTSFRADWTDATIPQNVTSYTLEVETKPTYYLLEEADWSSVAEAGFSDQTQNAANYFPAGWTFAGAGLWAEDGCISISGNFGFTTPTYSLADEGKMTVVITAKSGYSASSLTVSTSVAETVISVADRTFTQYVAVLDCADADHVTITNKSGNPYLLNMQVYAGQPGESTLRASESGDETQRTITGITDKFYTVTGLTASGKFRYKVKALYIDGTESAWSNAQDVTLVEGAHNYDLGDVNHDHKVNITDVMQLINHVSIEAPVCDVCGDLNGDRQVNITDVTILINKILNEN